MSGTFVNMHRKPSLRKFIPYLLDCCGSFYCVFRWCKSVGSSFSMRPVKTKYSLWWIAITTLFATIIWLVVYFIPNEGWIFWSGIRGIILFVVAYLCLTVVIIALYAVETYQDEISSGFCKFGHSMIEACNDYYEAMWRNFYASLGRLLK